MIFIFGNFKYHIILIFWEVQVFVDMEYFGWMSYLDIFIVVDIIFKFLELQGNFWKMRKRRPSGTPPIILKHILPL
jgi:hypothetical protein